MSKLSQHGSLVIRISSSLQPDCCDGVEYFDRGAQLDIQDGGEVVL